MVDATVERRDFYVYVIFRPDGSPCYVGKGQKDRWKKHAWRSTNPHLAAIYKSTDCLLPIVKVREGLLNDEANRTEIALIAAIGRETEGGPLVNLTGGGEGVSGPRNLSPQMRDKARKQLEEIRSRPGFGKRVSAGLTGRKRSPEECVAIGNGHRGRKYSASHSENVSKAKRGIPLSPEHAAAISASLVGRVFSEEHRAKLRRPCREDTRAKLSAAKTGVKASEEHKEALRRGWIKRKQRHPHRTVAERAAISAGMAAKRASNISEQLSLL